MSEHPEADGYTREQLVHFLASRLREEPTPSLQTLRDEGAREGFIVRRRDYDEAMRLAGPGAGPPAAAATPAEIRAEMTPDPDPLRPFTDADAAPATPLSAPAPADVAIAPTVAEPQRSASRMTKPKKPLTRRQWMEAAIAAVAPAPAPAAPPAVARSAHGPSPATSAPAGRRRAPRGVDVAGLAALLAEYQNIVDERDRLRDALEAIQRALKAATGRG